MGEERQCPEETERDRPARDRGRDREEVREKDKAEDKVRDWDAWAVPWPVGRWAFASAPIAGSGSPMNGASPVIRSSARTAGQR